MKILVTGGSGFVGKAALAALMGTSAEVTAVSRSRPALSGRFDWRALDLLDAAATARVLSEVRPDAILHMAWCVEHGKFWTADENLDWAAATLALARAGAASGIRRFVGTGTCYEYEWPADAACSERTTPVVPSLLYGIAKDAARRLLQEFCATKGIEFAWARIFFPYGPGENSARLVPSVAAALSAGKPALCGSGRGIRDFLAVEDAGRALSMLATSSVSGAVNIASGQAVTIADVALELGRLADRADLIRLGALPDRPGEPPRIVADITRLRDEVGFQAAITLDHGLRAALEAAGARSQ